jgi:hypothetical protein
MKSFKNGLSVTFLFVASLILAACANSGGAQTPATPPPENPSAQAAPAQNPTPAPTSPSPDNGQAAASATQSSDGSQANPDIVAMLKDEKDYDWSIYVKDSSAISMGPIKTTVMMDLKASNTSGGIEGSYTGTATSSSQSVNSAYSSTATSDTKVGTVNFSLGVPLAPLVPEKPEENGALPPLVTPENEPDYEGDGTFVLSNPTGMSQIQGMGVSVQKEHTSASTHPFHISVKGAQVRMTMTTPQGDLYFDGYIRGEEKK